MTKQVINIGTTANDGKGDSLRVGALKINQNFDELYSALGTGNTINLVSSIIAGEGISVNQSTGQVTITNTSPNRNTFKTIEPEGAGPITATNLVDVLRINKGANIRLESNPATNTITISAGDDTGSIIIPQNSVLRLASYTDQEREVLLPFDGDLIYNSSANKIQGYHSGTWFDATNTDSLLSGAAVLKLTTTDLVDTTGRLTANGPLIVLAGGDGGENSNANYTQLQWTADTANPDLVKSQYLWLDSNGVSIQTNDPGVYSNVWSFRNDGMMQAPSAVEFPDLSKVGPVQTLDGIDLYAPAGSPWAQLNYDNRVFVWATSSDVNIDVLTDLPGASNVSWKFDGTGMLTLPGGGNIVDNSGNPIFISLADLKAIAAESTDFNDFKTRIAAL